MSEDPIQVAIPYATPEPRRPSKTWAATALLFGGLGLVLLGGCFMIGVLTVMNSALLVNTGQHPGQALAILLLVLALGCFAGAVWLIVLGVKSLLQIVRS